MLHLKKINILCTLLYFTLFFSCSINGLEREQQQNLFEAFASKDNILSLPLEDQKQLWIKRLEMYYDLDLNSDQESILNNLITDLKKMEEGKFFISEAIRKDAIAMARITPKDDFIRLYCLEMATTSMPILSKSGTICLECIVDLENYVIPIAESSGAVSYRAENCDCLWTCTYQADNMLCDNGQSAVVLNPCSGTQTSGCCNPAGGCGLFGLQTCTGLAACPS